MARAAKEAGVRRLVHMSALGADPESHSDYADQQGGRRGSRPRGLSEAAIVRPSVVFGPEDEFFNLFASLARFSPASAGLRLPKPGFRDGRIDFYGDGGVKFQPVYVGDVAAAIVKCIEDPACAGKTYELGGPAVYSFKQIMEMICRETGRKRLLLPVPYMMAGLAATFLQLMPKPLLTTDQVELLKHDNVVSGELPTLADLGIEPTGAEGIIPTYLDRYRSGGRFTKPRLA